MSAPATPRTARSAKGFRVIRSVRLAAAEAPTPGQLGSLWQRLCAALHVTPQQWHAHALARQAGTEGDALRGRVLMAGGHMTLMPHAPPTSSRCPAQADLP